MRPDSPSWLKAKRHGDAGEAAAAAMWDGMGFAAGVRVGAKPSDLVVSAKVEHKADLKAPRTGRVAVEFSRSGEPSGIATTDAGIWCFTVGWEFFVIPTRELRRLAEQGPFHIDWVGDRKQSLCVFVPVSELRRGSILVLPMGRAAS